MTDSTTMDDHERKLAGDETRRTEREHRHTEGEAVSLDSETHDRPGSADARWMSVDEIREVYAEHADRMERIAPVNRLLTGRYRRELFGTADGRVLDVACGMGMNLEYLPESVEYVGIDVSPAMLRKAEERYDRLERGETLREMDAEDLAFPENGFETVISSLSTCTFPDPVAALREMDRVCAPDGRVLLEHGRSDVGAIARLQDWRADAHYEKEGCRWNQRPVEIVAGIELSIQEAKTGPLGIITAIEARPHDAEPS